MMVSQSTLEERFGKCPFATVQSLIAGKWAVLILLYLEDGPIRFNELLRRMPKMTHATLSVQLKSLEEYGLDLKNTIYFGSHPSNIVSMQGRLPKHKQAMIEAVREKREQLRRHLDEYPRRGGEGSILNR